MTQIERKEYMADYNRHYYEVRSGKPTVSEIMKDILLIIPPTKINFNGNEEPIVCSHFGCNHHLTLNQQLYGSKCPAHQSTEKIDPTKFVSHPHKQSA